MRPDWLRCEHAVDPLGIDVRRPRLRRQTPADPRAVSGEDAWRWPRRSMRVPPARSRHRSGLPDGTVPGIADIMENVGSVTSILLRLPPFPTRR